jgi:hypothetical protein
LRVTVEVDGGEQLDVFLKPSARPEVGIEGMANELLAACVAGHLELPVCEPIAVRMSPEWIGSIQDVGLQQTLTRSCPIAFGSVAAGSGWRAWTEDDRIIGERRAAALGIFAFDMFSENRDRVVSNPNLLIRGDSFRIIDHELCFRIRQCLFPKPEPWQLGYLQGATQHGPSGHVFGALLRGDRYLEYGPLRLAWTSLSDDALSDYGASIPNEWASATNAVEDALTHLRAVRDRIDECLAEVERALT